MLFLSSTTNRIDKKGRVSVPAPFRAVLAAQKFSGIYASVSIRFGCIEAFGPGYFQKLHQRIEALDPFSAERDALSSVVFGESVQLSFDADGRVLLPPQLLAHAGLKEEAVFVGKGEFFEIWEPKAYAARAKTARAMVREKLYGGQAMSEHTSVMLDEVITALKPTGGGTYVDSTFGAGGYSRAILQAAECKVFAIDRDPDTRAFAETLEREFPGRFAWLVGNFSDMCTLLRMNGVSLVDGVVLDLGVSSMQLDERERGFSFRGDGPLDMRMEREGQSAADVVNTASEAQLADILYLYGEERASRRIAHAIVQARAAAPITRTSELAELVRGVAGRGDQKKDPATRTFQALRIHVNDELGALTRGLSAAEALLREGGRLVVVTFHSLEDRLVKQFAQERSGKAVAASRYVPEVAKVKPPTFAHAKKIKVSVKESARNPRARSATLRTAVRTDAPSWEKTP